MSQEQSFILQGGVSSVLVAYFQNVVLRMIPYAVAAVPLIILDLIYGIQAAKYRGERARLSTAVRRSVTKTFSYVCWLILATSLAISFELKWIEWVVLGSVYVNELASIVGNYLETKGIKFSYAGFLRLLFKKGADKVGIEITSEEVKEIIKPRDSHGRFVKKEVLNG